MSVKASTLRKLATLSLEPEQMAGVLELLAEQAEADEELRAKEDERKRKDRERKADRKSHGNSAESSRNSPEVPEEIPGTTLSLPPSPQTPQPPTHTRECVTSRTRKGADDFEQFWAVYPRKVAKDVARKAFYRALGKVPVEMMIAAVERQRAWDQWQRGFIPHAATWLNAGRWADEEPETPVIPLRKAHDRPHPDDKLSRKQANLARAFAGSERAAGFRGEP